jgi:hypothetical protein
MKACMLSLPFGLTGARFVKSPTIVSTPIIPSGPRMGSSLSFPAGTERAWPRPA